MLTVGRFFAAALIPAALVSAWRGYRCRAGDRAKHAIDAATMAAPVPPTAAGPIAAPTPAPVQTAARPLVDRDHRGSRTPIPSDAGLLPYRELDEALRLTDTGRMRSPTHAPGKNGRYRLAGCVSRLRAADRLRRIGFRGGAFNYPFLPAGEGRLAAGTNTFSTVARKL
jgi:hypothetical protein